MKVLVHITEKNTFIVANERTGVLYEYTKQEISENGYKIKHISASTGRVNQNLYPKFKSQGVMVVSALAENKKIFGYMLYVPVYEKVICVSGDTAADLASTYGLVYGKVRSTPSNKKRYIEGNFPIQQGYNHKQVYLNLYKERKEKAERLHKPVEKIVRPDINSIEMRYLPPFVFESYKEPRGVNVFNFKWYKLMDDNLSVLKRPQVTNLDISTYCEYIKYNVKLSEKYQEALLRANCSLGAFAHWKIKTLVLGHCLKEIGQESFYDNFIEEVTIPYNVTVIGKSAFMKNAIKTLTFDKGKDLVLGEYAFADNNLTEICIPNNIISIGGHCFSNNTSLGIVQFESGCKIEELMEGVFNRCDITNISLPDSIKKVHPGAFSGCDNLKTIRLSKNSVLWKDKGFMEEMKSQGIHLMYE